MARRLADAARLAALAALVVLALLAPQAALAEPAVIGRFEAVARAEPTLDAPPLQTLVEGTAVSVSEEAQGGWRRVRLADGRVAWIEEQALAFPGKATPAPAAPPPPLAPLSLAAPPPPPPPDLRAKIYVKDLDHLAELVKDDPAVHQKALELARRRTTAYTVFGVGLAVGLGCVLYGVSQANQHTDLNDPQFGKSGNAGGAFALGAASTGLGTLVALVVAPKEGDLLDVINGWNAGHPDQPFTIGSRHLDR